MCKPSFLSLSWSEKGTPSKRSKFPEQSDMSKVTGILCLSNLLSVKYFYPYPHWDNFMFKWSIYVTLLSLMFPFSSSSWVKMAISHKMFKIFGANKNSTLTETQTIDVCCLFIMRNIFDIWEKWLPKDVHVLIPRICDYVTWHGKRDLTDVTKLRIFFL